MRWLCAIISSLAVAAAGPLGANEDYASNEAVQLLQQYVKINTTTHNDLSDAVEFWDNLAQKAKVDITVHNKSTGYPIIVLKWPGKDPSLPSVMLNSHMDVVPAIESDGWNYPPFSAHIDEDGVIWGRGTQDMKNVAISHYMALKRIKEQNVKLLRNVFMTLMPDEEVGGDHGMTPFLQSKEFAALNVGVEFDEGTASAGLPVVPVFYQDKVVWQIEVECNALAEHGSQFPATNDTATGKCINVINKMFEFRDEEHKKFETMGGIMNAGVYTSINLNRINAGIANNIVPGRVTLLFDIRLGVNVKEDELDARLKKIVSEAGENVTLTYISKDHQSPATVVNNANPYWTAIADVAKKQNITILPIVPPGSTDARFVRDAGYPAFGFTPLPNTELLLHQVNERINASLFLKGIDIYENLIKSVANLPGNATSTNPRTYIVDT